MSKEYTSLGLMSGTSGDGIDASIIKSDGISKYEVLFNNLKASDPLNFTDTKTYPKRVKEANKKTGLAEAISVAYGNSCSKPLTIASMDFSYIGGSMGSVVGEKISRAIDHSIKTKSPLLIISKSGGARMMEGAFS